MLLIVLCLLIIILLIYYYPRCSDEPFVKHIDIPNTPPFWPHTDTSEYIGAYRPHMPCLTDECYYHSSTPLFKMLYGEGMARP